MGSKIQQYIKISLRPSEFIPGTQKSSSVFENQYNLPCEKPMEEKACDRIHLYRKSIWQHAIAIDDSALRKLVEKIFLGLVKNTLETYSSLHTW